MQFLIRYSLPISIAVLTLAAAACSAGGAYVMRLSPVWAACLGSGFGALFVAGLWVSSRYGSTIEPITQDEYDDLNDPINGGPDEHG